MVFYIYKDKAGEYRWQLQSENHKVIADSGEGYKNRADFEHGINLVKSTSTYTPVEEGIQN